MTLQDRAAQWLSAATATNEVKKSPPIAEADAIIRELLAEVERLTNPSHCPECGCQGSVRGFCQTCDLKTDRDCLLDKVARLEDRIVELVHEREDSPPPADAALLALANRELLAQIAAKDERIRAAYAVLDDAIRYQDVHGLYSDLMKAACEAGELLNAAQTASEGE